METLPAQLIPFALLSCAAIISAYDVRTSILVVFHNDWPDIQARSVFRLFGGMTVLAIIFFLGGMLLPTGLVKLVGALAALWLFLALPVPPPINRLANR